MDHGIKNVSLLFDGRLLKRDLVGYTPRADVRSIAKNLIQALCRIPSVSLHLYLPSKDKDFSSQLREQREFHFSNLI